MGSPWSPQLYLAAFFTFRPSSRLRGRAIAFASMPISFRKTSIETLIQPSSIPLTLKRHGRPPKKAEALINTMADHLARQTEEIYFATIGQIPRAVERHRGINALW